MGLSEILVVAGEASGDQHAAAVVREAQRLKTDVRFFGMGGPRLREANVELLYDASEVSVMGLVEVLPKLRRILAVKRGLQRAASRRRPRCALLVDIPDFNLRLARDLRALDIPVVYFISPSVWAWREGRVDTVSARVNEMLCILPFEEPFYRQRGVQARYVGNPVLEQVPTLAPASSFRVALGLPQDTPTLALLPGSRKSELRRILPVMAQSARLLDSERPGLQIVVPLAPGISRAQVSWAFTGLRVALIEGRAPQVVGASDVAVVASGTAVLEAGLMGRPLVVVYRVAPLTYWMAKPLVRVPHFSLVNLLAGRALVPELIQSQMTPERIAREAQRLWPPSSEGMAQVKGLAEVRKVLGPPGAAGRAAEALLQWA
jgi:lipid-A-disaccharide synthase